MLRAIYVVLLRLHPRFFREEFADEMLWIFDRSRGRSGALLRDVVRSLATQWMFRSDFDQPAATQPAFDRVPVFYTSGSEIPPPGALINGLIGSTAVFALACFALSHGGGHPRVYTYDGGEFHAGPPAYGEPSGPTPIGSPTGGPTGSPAKAAEPGVWAKVESMLGKNTGRQPDSAGNQTPPGQAAASPRSLSESSSLTGPSALIQADQRQAAFYFKFIPILAALDTDHNGELSAEEIANAPSVLLALDKNQDGKLDAEECGYRRPRPPVPRTTPRSQAQPSRPDNPRLKRLIAVAQARDIRRERINFMRMEPVLSVLDADHDSLISMSEIGNAPAALKTLDRNHDGRLTLDEVLRDPVDIEVAGIFSLDSDYNGRISPVERQNPFGEHARVLLDAADHNGNGDGLVSWEELGAEIRRRTGVGPDGRVTWEKLRNARASGALYGARQKRP